MFRIVYFLKQLEDRLWLRPALFSLIALLTPLTALLLQGVVPLETPLDIGAGAVEDVLNILASSLLAVTTFSLGTMVAAYAAATRNVTPRATRLLLADTTSQNVLATFIGVFLFALVSIIGLKTGIYTATGRGILFGVTMLMVLLTVFTLISWVDFLARFGRVGDTMDRVERVAERAIEKWRAHPALGGEPHDPDQTPPDDYVPIHADKIGYVKTVDMHLLSKLAEAQGQPVFLAALPGAFVHAGNPVAHVGPGLDKNIRADVAKAFVVGHMRSFEQDPRFGLLVMSEIASRALSSAVNDTGTAIEVIGRGVRLLSNLSPLINDLEAEARPEPLHPGVMAPKLRIADLFEDLFSPIARDGAAAREIQIRLQKAFIALYHADPDLFGAEVLTFSRRALEQSETALALEADRRIVRALAEQIRDLAGSSGSAAGRATSP